MELINRLRLKLESLEQRDFFKYLIILLAVILFFVGVLLFWHYRNVGNLQDELEQINDTREEIVFPILRRMDTVKLQRKQVNDILAKEPGFKIVDYLNNLINKQGLTVVKIDPTTVPLPNNFNEVVAKVQLVDMDMRQLCEFLETIEKNERVYAKDLEIIKSKKNPGTIEVNVTVATLEQKART